MPTRAWQEQTVRDRLLWRLLRDALRRVSQPGKPPLVLDCGGGSGRYAVPLAQGGADVTVIDISADALATLRRRAAEAGVAGRVHAIQGDVERLGTELTAPQGDGERRGTEFTAQRFDLALAHGVLEAVDDADVALGVIADAVRPDGLISILVANPVAKVLSRVLAGDISGGRDELLTATAGLELAAVTMLCERHGLGVEQIHGIGVFAELVPEARRADPDAVAALEDLAAGRPPYRDMAVRLHVLARRPQG